MILRMSKIRVYGPRTRLAETLDVLLDLGAVHLGRVDRDDPELGPVEPTPIERRHERYLADAAHDADRALAALPSVPIPIPRTAPRPRPVDWRRGVHGARRARIEAEALTARRRDLDAERVRLVRFVRFAAAFDTVLPAAEASDALEVYPLVVAAVDVPTLRRRFAAVFGEEFELRVAPLDAGEAAAILLVPPERAADMDAILAEAGVGELELPDEYAAGSLRDAAPAMTERIARIDAEIADLGRRLEELGRREANALLAIKGACVDRLRRLDAASRAVATTRLFVLDGWLPEHLGEQLEVTLAQRFHGEVVLDRLGVEGWAGEDAPVVLHNPPIFRPFEAVTRLVPLPRYGTIDPTPYVAIFFPMFFGLILGDVGYGGMLLLLAGVLRWRSEPDTTLRSVAEIALACGTFSILFGLAFGELLGDLGHRVLGMRPLVFARGEALVPFLGLTVALGFVHVLLGLILGFVGGLRGDRRRSIGRGIGILMVLLIGVAMLVPLQVLPQALFTPLVVAILVAFPILIALEGIIAPIELLSTFSHVLSYARIMALGTASVMMAVVANRLAGAMGSVVVGTLFALLFHLVNFVLGVFAPTIHGLRLHYVEFFGKFVSPGGVRYEPLRRWAPAQEAVA